MTYFKVVVLSGRITSQVAGIRHILVINRVRSDDDGTYMCYATNDLGASQKNIVFENQDITENHNNDYGSEAISSGLVIEFKNICFCPCRLEIHLNS